MDTATEATAPTTEIAATAPATAMAEAPVAAATDVAAAPRIKFIPDGYIIDHPDRATGERLMAGALGVSDRAAMDGLLRQLVRASINGERPDETNLAFMIAMVQNLRPRNSIEAMLITQMVSVHVMAMRCAQQLTGPCDTARQDSAARALGRLARTFPAQIDALTRYRSQSEPAITVQNVSVADGGKAIVGNVTQHRSVIVSARSRASMAARRARKGSKRRRMRAGSGPEAQA